jgi:hypothetical protein
MIHLFRDVDYGRHALFEILRQVRDRVCFLLEDKCGEKGCNFCWLVFGEDIVKDQLCQDEFICRMNLGTLLAMVWQ